MGLEWGLDWLNALMSAFAFFIYGSICFISLLFTFSLDKYCKLEEVLDVNVITIKILTPLDLNIDVIDDWLMEHNKIVGPILVVLSIIDTKLSFNLINMF